MRRLASILASTLLLVACSGGAQPGVTHIEFLEPKSATIECEGQKGVFPVRIAIGQTADPASEGGRVPIRLEAPGGPRLKGFLYVYPTQTPEGELTIAQFRLLPAHIAHMRSTGEPVTISGYAPNKETLYRVILGLDLDPPHTGGR